MTHEGASVASPRGKVPTGYGRLDELLQGGFLAGSAVLLSAPASGEVPILVRNFLKTSGEVGLLICRSQSSAEAVSQPDDTNLKCMICSEKPTPPSNNMLQGKGIDNLTELNFQITETVASVQPKRIVLEILSDILLRHKALQTRKWLSELLEKLRLKGITTLSVFNPYMHASEEVQAVVDLFDGTLEIIEKDVEGQLQKFLRIKWMRGSEVAEKEFPLVDLIAETQAPRPQITRPTHFKEPRWLTPLVGRTAELSKLKAAFNDAVNNKSSIVTVHGEAGVGKTRLMRELAVSVQEGVVVLAGRAGEEKIAYGPWVELLREYVGQTPGEMLRRMLGVSASEVARLVPDIAAKIGTVPPSKPLAEEQDRIRLFEAVTQFLISICNEKPLLLLLDDMHWADQASLGLLEHFVMGSSNSRVLTLVAYRTEDVSTESPLSKTLMKLNRERVLESVSVKNLNNQETTEMIKQTFGEPTVSPEFADLIYNRTGGNPFFVEEVLRSLVEDGTIFRTEKGWDRKPIQEIVLPESVKSLLKSRLTKLQPETLNILTVASVIGSEFDFEVLREVTQTQEDTLLDRIETAVTAGLISEVPGRKDVFRFVDNRIRELLLGDLLQSRRTRYHVKIAEAMEKAYSKNLENRAESIAAHFSEGGDTERTIKYSLTAGDRNRAIHAYEQAIADYKHASELIAKEENKDPEKALILEKLGECYLGTQVPESKRYFEQALAIYEKLGDKKACARTCAKLAEALQAKWEGRAMEQSIVTLKRGLKYLEREPESFEAASIYSRLAWYTGTLDEWDEANSWAEKALEVGERSNNSAAVSGGLMIKGSYLTDTGHIDEGLPLWERAFEMAMQHEHYTEAFDSLFNLAIYTYPRNLSKARELAVRLLDLSKRVNDMSWQTSAYYDLYYCDWLGGNWTVALEEYHNWNEIGKRIGVSVLTTDPPRYNLARGDLTQTEIGLQEWSKLEEGTRKASMIVSVNLWWGLLRLEQGRDAEAKAHFLKSVEAFRKWEFTTWPLEHIETLLYLTQLHVKDSELEQARKTWEWAKRLAETLKSDAGLAMASQAEAYVLLAGEDRKGAEEACLKSLGLWEKAGWPYYHAKALVAHSETMAGTNPEESKKRLKQAAEIFKKLGAKRDLEKAEAKLSAKPQPRPAN